MSLLRPLLLFSSAVAALGITACSAPDDSFDDAQWRGGYALAGSPDCDCPMCSCWMPTHTGPGEDRLMLQLHVSENDNGLPFLKANVITVQARSQGASLSARIATSDLWFEESTGHYVQDLELSRWSCKLDEEYDGAADFPEPLDPLDPMDAVDPIEPLDPIDAVDPVDAAGCRDIAYAAALEASEDLETVEDHDEDAIRALNDRFKVIVWARDFSIAIPLAPHALLSPE